MTSAPLAILMPVFNDWDSAAWLLTRIDSLPLWGIRVLLVDDGSTQPAPPTLAASIGQGSITAAARLELACNVGHQRAIALGLAHLAQTGHDGPTLVMDSDGEDAPDDIPALLAEAVAYPGAIVVAARHARSEGPAFRLGYAAYRRLFHLLTGRRIAFGNFSTFGPAALRRLVHMPETWNHLAAAMLRSRLPLRILPTRRAPRYAGRSTMSYPALIAHGLSAFAVFSDHVFARLLVLACGVGLFALLSAAIVTVIRLATDLATPGWATTVVGISLVFFLQSLLITLVAAVQMLATRSQAGAQPAALHGLFVTAVHDIPLGRR